MKAIGRTTVSGMPKRRMCSVTETSGSHDPIPVPAIPVPAEP